MQTPGKGRMGGFFLTECVLPNFVIVLTRKDRDLVKNENVASE